MGGGESQREKGEYQLGISMAAIECAGEGSGGGGLP